MCRHYTHCLHRVKKFKGSTSVNTVMVSTTLAGINQVHLVLGRNLRLRRSQTAPQMEVCPQHQSYGLNLLTRHQQLQSGPADLALGVHTNRRADPYLPAGDQLAGNEAEQPCRFRPPPSAMVPQRQNR